MSILKNDINQAIEAAQTKNYFLEAQDLVQLASFTVDQDFYVIDNMRIKQIIEPTEITLVRNTPEYLKGVIELRNTIIPIIDLRERLGLKRKEQDRYTKYLIVIVHSKVLGIIVDSVNEIITIFPDLNFEGSKSYFFLNKFGNLLFYWASQSKTIEEQKII